jgi:hypothetical protein
MAIKIMPDVDRVYGELKKAVDSLELVYKQKAGSETGMVVQRYYEASKKALNDCMGMPTDATISVSSKFGIFAQERAVHRLQEAQSTQDASTQDADAPSNKGPR